MISRRRFVQHASWLTAGTLGILPSGFGEAVVTTYQNPILGGDHPDASPIRVGEEFYLTHSSFDYAPGLLIWHSKDLVNWRPVAAALRRYYGSVWAPYLCAYEGRFLYLLSVE